MDLGKGLRWLMERDRKVTKGEVVPRASPDGGDHATGETRSTDSDLCRMVKRLCILYKMDMCNIVVH
jgi:hypothetical protein